MEVSMQKWPYVDIGYVNVEHFRSTPKNQKWEYLTVEAVFASENIVQFFDHYAKEYKSQRSELDEYLVKLGADRWKLTTAGMFDGKKFQFRRYQFRREIE